MESRVIFHDGMDNDPADYNKLQDFVSGSLDHVVADGLNANRRFAGFDAAKTGVAEVTVQAGRLYSSGRVYGRNAVFTKDFTTSLPLATKKIVSVVVWGSEVDTDTRPREFLINEETGASEPRAVSMERARVANINTASGEESPDPVPPLLDIGVLEVARILLSATGVESVEMMADNRLVSADALDGRAKTLEDFKQRTEPAIVALSSDIAKLTQGQTNSASANSIGRILTRLATIEERDGIPAAAADSDADFFLDTEESDTAHANYSAKVFEGVRLGDAASDSKALAIFDALNPRAKIVGGVLFPAYSRERRLTVGPRAGEAQIAAYSYQTHEMVQKTMSRVRIRYGEEYTVSTTGSWWLSGQYDYVGETFAKAGETLNPRAKGGRHPNAPTRNWVRQPRYWVDRVEEAYWEDITVDVSVPGAQIAETFLNSNDMWLDAIGLHFTRLAASGTVHIAICETERGQPNLSSVIATTTVARADLKLWPEETVIPLQPVYLQGGVRYAIVVTTAADHWVATTSGTAYPQGTFFYVLDGAYQQGDGARDLMFNLYAAKFSSARAVIEMAPLSLSGGITTLDVLTDAVVPDSTDFTPEIQVGSVWHPVRDVNESVLGAGGNVPPLVPLRLVFTGTPDVMPAVRLTGSLVRVSRPNTSFVHISTARTLPGSGSDEIRVIARLESFDAAFHTAVCKLLIGGGFASTETADSYSDAAQDDGSIERTWVFNLAGGDVTAFKIRLEGTTSQVLKPFHIALRKDYAL